LWSDGDALPAAQEMAKKYGVHRHTVRQAYKHLEDHGIVNIRRGVGTFVCTGPLTYPLGTRVSFRSNMAAMNKTGSSHFVESSTILATEQLAETLATIAGASLWRIELINSVDRVPVSFSRHFLCQARFPDFPERLKNSDLSLTRCLATYGIHSYERMSTRISARTASDRECGLLHLPEPSAVLITRAIDAAHKRPIQFVHTAFRADAIDLLVESHTFTETTYDTDMIAPSKGG
jgi:GntR family phosphonate transport system transcriptional regulator